MGHGLPRVLSLMHPHTCYQALLDRMTACVSHTENATKFCGCGKTRVHYLAHCCQTNILHCTACCAVLCKLILSLRCVLSGCTVTSRPHCIHRVIHKSLRDFRTRLRNNQDRHGRKEDITQVENLSKFFFVVLGALAYFQVPPPGGSRD